MVHGGLRLLAMGICALAVSCGGKVGSQATKQAGDTPAQGAPAARGCPGAIGASRLATPGQPRKLASASQVLGVDVGVKYVFYVVYRDTDVMLWKVPKAGGDAVLVGPSDWNVRVDDLYAYAGPRYPVDGGPAALAGASPGFSFALDGAYMYSADFTEVRREPKGGGDRTTIASGRNGAQGISTAGDWVYWADYSGDQVLRAPKAGGAVEVLATGHFPRHVIADCVQAFATIGNYGGPVIAVDLAPPHATKTVAPLGSSLAIDDGALYVFGPTVFRVPLDGSSEPQPIGKGSAYDATGGAVQIAVDETSVFWAADDGVWAAPK